MSNNVRLTKSFACSSPRNTERISAKFGKLYFINFVSYFDKLSQRSIFVLCSGSCRRVVWYEERRLTVSAVSVGWSCGMQTSENHIFGSLRPSITFFF